MKKFIVVIIFCTLFMVFCTNKYSGRDTTEILSLISKIENNPIDTTRDIRIDNNRKLFNFTVKPGVFIVISDSLTPWLTKIKNQGWQGVILSAFLAGCIKNAVKGENIKENNYYGTLEVFKVYQRIRAIDSSFVSPEIEGQMLKERQNTLKKFIHENLE